MATLLYGSANYPLGGGGVGSRQSRSNLYSTPRYSRFDSQSPLFSSTNKAYPSTLYGGGGGMVGRSRRSVSLNRPTMTNHYSILDEIVDRRQLSLKNHLDDARYHYQRSKDDNHRREISLAPATMTDFRSSRTGISSSDKLSSAFDDRRKINNDQNKENPRVLIVQHPNIEQVSAMVQERVENWSCSNCKEKCPGFKAHRWRSICNFCKCSINDHESSAGGIVCDGSADHQQRYPSAKAAESVEQFLAQFGISLQFKGNNSDNRPASSALSRDQPVVQPIAAAAMSAASSGTATTTGGGGGHHGQPSSHHHHSSSSSSSMMKSYSWIPPGVPHKKVEEYMSQLPNHKVPRHGTSGEKYREKQLMLQLPRQDLAPAYCKHLNTPQEQSAFEDFVNIRNETALDIGSVYPSLDKSTECRKCRGFMAAGEIAVTAPKLTNTVYWHPSCFTCQTCDELLVDLTYCVGRDDRIFCERHYAETLKPRCGACDELIFAGEYTKAMNQDWHSNHFCCWQCDQVLTGQRYILRDEHPYCIKCYEEVFANTCDECGKPIGIDSKDLSYKEKHWHETCFLCSMCKVSLVDKPFGSKNDRIFCANCYDQAFATRCDGCGEIFKAGMKKMEYKGKQWHDKCFCCALCKCPIGTRSFIPKNEEVYCAGCYEDKFATRCTKCKKVITSGGVTYKNEPFHRECFVCRHCNSSLAGQRFTSKDEKPYCANCFGELFAKRCTLCTKPITGIGGSKFISFEDRHWHNDCFICAQCETSLVGQGFITDGPDILCPECAKARLMAQHA